MKHLNRRLMFGSSLGLLLSAIVLSPARAINDAHGYYDYYDKGKQPSTLLRDVESHHLGLGLEYMRNLQYTRAEQDARFILDYFPNHPGGLAFISELAERIKKPQLAEQYFQTALQLYPSTASTYAIYAVFLFRNGRIDQSISSYRRALEYDPSVASTHYNLGLAYLEKKEYSLANEEAHKAYAMGYNLPGLQKKLERVGAWQPIDNQTIATPAEGIGPSGNAPPKN